MTVLWGALIATHAIIAVFVVVWGMSDRWVPSLERKSGRLCFGLLLGATCVVAISMAAEVMPGFKFDLRHALLAASGLFGGPIAACATALIAAAYRAYLGGGGALAGVIGIAATACIGIAGHYAIGRSRRTLTKVLGFSVAVGFGVLISFPAIDASVRYDLLQKVGPPMVVMTFFGTLIAILLIDIEVRKRKAYRDNRLYRAMVMAMPDCLNVKDTNGHFILANEATANIMRAPDVESLTGRTDFDFYPEAKAKEFQAEEDAILEAGLPRQVEQLLEFEDGSQTWVSTMKVPLRDSKGKPVGLITHNRDITEVHNLTVQKEQFISSVSHELRSPVTAIRGALALVRSAAVGDLPPKAAKLIDTAERNARRLAALIDDILDFEKVVSGRMDFAPEEICVTAAVTDTMDASAHYLPEKSVKLKLVDQAPDAQVFVNPQRLQQVLSNLLSNAIKFSPDGGTVTVNTCRTDGVVDIAVRDEGPGVPKEFEDQLFKRYSQEKITASKSNVAGTGLGLSIAKEMVTRMGGDIVYHRNPGFTEFLIRLPDSRVQPMAKSA